MDLKIDGPAINEYIAKAVLDSTIGKGLTAKIDKEVSGWLTGYDSPIKKVFIEVVEEEMRRQFATENNQIMIRESVARVLREDVLKDILDKTVKSLMDAIRSHY